MRLIFPSVSYARSPLRFECSRRMTRTLWSWWTLLDRRPENETLTSWSCSTAEMERESTRFSIHPRYFYEYVCESCLNFYVESLYPFLSRRFRSTSSPSRSMRMPWRGSRISQTKDPRESHWRGCIRASPRRSMPWWNLPWLPQWGRAQGSPLWKYRTTRIGAATGESIGNIWIARGTNWPFIMILITRFCVWVYLVYETARGV